MQLKWFEAVIDRIQPTLRSGCNYVNLDRIRAQSEWNDYETKWILPKLTVEKVTLPSTNSGESFDVFPIRVMQFLLSVWIVLFMLLAEHDGVESSSWHSDTMLSENVACCFRWQFSLRSCEINKFAVFCHLICNNHLWLCLDAFRVFIFHLVVNFLLIWPFLLIEELMCYKCLKNWQTAIADNVETKITSKNSYVVYWQFI